jgi:hypothetical protein
VLILLSLSAFLFALLSFALISRLLRALSRLCSLFGLWALGQGLEQEQEQAEWVVTRSAQLAQSTHNDLAISDTALWRLLYNSGCVSLLPGRGVLLRCRVFGNGQHSLHHRYLPHHWHPEDPVFLHEASENTWNNSVPHRYHPHLDKAFFLWVHCGNFWYFGLVWRIFCNSRAILAIITLHWTGIIASYGGTCYRQNCRCSCVANLVTFPIAMYCTIN